MRRVLSSSEKKFSLDELENAYPQEVKSIRYILECDDPETLESLSLSFTDEKGVLVDVTANRSALRVASRLEMTQRIIDDDSASDIRDGLLHVLKPAALGMLSLEEFILAVCGSHDIDVDEWRRSHRRAFQSTALVALEHRRSHENGRKGAPLTIFNGKRPRSRRRFRQTLAQMVRPL